MFFNYIKIAWRNLQRNRMHSFINIAGLALGLACALFIFLWVRDELGYDRLHTKQDRIYRVLENQYWGDLKTSEYLPWHLASSLKEEFPEIEKAAMVPWLGKSLLKAGDKATKFGGIYSTEDLFDIFSFPLNNGDAKKLADPNSILISRKVAEYFFKDVDPIGKSLLIDTRQTFQVAGVFENIPAHSSIRFDYVLPKIVFERKNPWVNHWGNHGFKTYVLLSANANPVAVGNKIKGFLKKKNKESMEEIWLQPMSNVYLYSEFKNGKEAGGRIGYVKLFTGIAILILIIACINFMNLATARSAKRAKEVGVRKVIGADRKFLILQFFGESVLTAIISWLVSLLLVYSLLPYFNTITGKEIDLLNNNNSFIVAGFLLACITGLIAGSYPALLLSSLKPVSIFRANLKTGTGSEWLRKGLVVFQFSISILLVIGTIVIHRQMEYIQNKNLGVEKENIVSIGMEGDLFAKYELAKDKLLKLPGISSVTRGSNAPIEVEGRSTDPVWDGKPQDMVVTFAGLNVDYGYLSTHGIKLLDGRDFSSQFADSNSYIVNETAARIMGMKNPVGENLDFWNGKGKIVGLVRDFHVASLHKPIEPLIILYTPGNSWYMFVKTKAGETKTAIANLEKVLKEINPAYPPEYKFVDETFNQQYKSESIVSQLTNIFSFQAILIACLGLFGLVTFSTEQRRKEIGIRKVIGASVSGIVAMLSRDFLKLVLIAAVVSCPIAWWAMDNWLADFAYRTNLSWWIFVVAALLAILIALVTISFQAVRSALANPVNSLRSE